MPRIFLRGRRGSLFSGLAGEPAITKSSEGRRRASEIHDGGSQTREEKWGMNKDPLLPAPEEWRASSPCHQGRIQTVRRSLPVISDGFAIPIIARSVGATSERVPPVRRLPLFESSNRIRGT